MTGIWEAHSCKGVLRSARDQALTDQVPGAGFPLLLSLMGKDCCWAGLHQLKQARLGVDFLLGAGETHYSQQ